MRTRTESQSDRQTRNMEKRQYLLAIGVCRELAGMYSEMTSMLRDRARNTVMAREIFSPLSGGNRNTVIT